MLLKGVHYGFFISQHDADSVVALHVRLVLREIEVGEFRFILFCGKIGCCDFDRFYN